MEAPENAQEIRVLTLLGEQFPQLAESYRNNLARLSENLEKSCGNYHPNLRWRQGTMQEDFFRLDFDMPVIFVMSHELSRFRTYKQYVIPMTNERKFYAELALVPVYFFNFNRICCLKIYGDEASRFFAQDSRPLIDEIAWILESEPSRPAQFSSMNLILKQGSAEQEIPADLRSVISDSFSYGFWCYPKKGFGSNAHIFFSRDNINRVHKVYKCIYIIKRIHPPRKARLAPYYTAYVQRADVKVVGSKQSEFAVYLARDVVKKLEEENTVNSYRNINNLIINGMIYELVDKGYRPEGSLRLLSIMSELLPSENEELLKTIISYCVTELFNSSDTFGYIGSNASLNTNVKYMLELCNKLGYHSVSPAMLSHQGMDGAIEGLFPVVINYENQIYFVHPGIIAAFIDLGLDREILSRNGISIINFIDLLEEMRLKDQPLTRLRYTDQIEYFNEMDVSFRDLVRVLRSTYSGIQLSRSLHNFF